MFIADLHIHSKYSRATSRECVPEVLDLWARRKGLQLIGTGDFTHAAWRAELREKLIPAEEGLYRMPGGETRFIVSGEISSIYKKNGRVRKVHNLILLPGLEVADRLSRKLEAIGNLHSDGRPILGLDSRDLLEITLETCPAALFIPAHIWTPHFSLFGAYSGFDDIHECFEDLTCHIHALETGLSSDPPMNWRLSALDGFAMVSNSDAHSPANLAREANLFDVEIGYAPLARALEHPEEGGFAGTIEFFPEEGKYHADGHRRCKVCLTPRETRALDGRCPVCGGRITVGVWHRVEALADRGEGFVPGNARRFESLVPLREVVASALGVTAASKRAGALYDALLREVGPELAVLREAPIEDIARSAGPVVAECVRRLRAGRVRAEPGYDGEYGTVRLIEREEVAELLGQLSLLEKQAAPAPKAPPEPVAALRRESAEERAPDELNPEQEEAVAAEDAVVLVVAGPGTGKTRTLVSRVARLIRERAVPAERIGAVTFTNRAAREMRERLAVELGGGRAAGEMTIGTFHAICLRMLAERMGDVTVIGEPEAMAVVAEVLAELGRCDRPRDALQAISLRKNGAVPVEEEDELFARYNARLAELGVLDYDDILLRALELAEAEGFVTPFLHLLVDEFQDINEVQYRLVRAWSRGGEGLFAIGDPDQSIYGFRGSDPHCFERLAEDFVNTRRVELRQNYRSTPQILSCAAASLRKEQPLEARREAGSKVCRIGADDAASEARFIAAEIARVVGGIDMLGAHAGTARERARGFSEIAILYRTNRQAEALERALVREGIPYVVAGRDASAEQEQVRAAIAFFRWLLRPGDALSQKAVKAARLEEWAGQYASRLREKPAKLVEGLATDLGAVDEMWAQRLVNTAVMYDDLPSFLQAMELGREADVLRSGERRYRRDAVSLMTLHAAKGLEFPVVFLAGLTEGLVPYQRHGGEVNPEEERRLFYVGLTRARDELFLTAPGVASPFLAALPGSAVEIRAAKEARRGEIGRQMSLF